MIIFQKAGFLILNPRVLLLSSIQQKQSLKNYFQTRVDDFSRNHTVYIPVLLRTKKKMSAWKAKVKMWTYSIVKNKQLFEKKLNKFLEKNLNNLICRMASFTEIFLMPLVIFLIMSGIIIYSFILSSFHSFIHSFIHSFFHSFIHLFIHSFVLSFVFIFSYMVITQII